MSENEGGFFSRWSQRKQAVKLGLAEEEKPQPKNPEPVQSKAAPLATAQQDAADNKAEPVKLPTLADVEQLTPQSDFSSFMTQGVTPEVRNAAMKKLFTDPHYNVMDGLDIYIGDYNTPDPCLQVCWPKWWVLNSWVWSKPPKMWHSPTHLKAKFNIYQRQA